MSKFQANRTVILFRPHAELGVSVDNRKIEKEVGRCVGDSILYFGRKIVTSNRDRWRNMDPLVHIKVNFSQRTCSAEREDCHISQKNNAQRFLGFIRCDLYTYVHEKGKWVTLFYYAEKMFHLTKKKCSSTMTSHGLVSPPLSLLNYGYQP